MSPKDELQRRQDNLTAALGSHDWRGPVQIFESAEGDLAPLSLTDSDRLGLELSNGLHEAIAGNGERIEARLTMTPSAGRTFRIPRESAVTSAGSASGSVSSTTSQYSAPPIWAMRELADVRGIRSVSQHR